MRDVHKTKDGKHMLISEMTDSHLLNTITLFNKMVDEGMSYCVGGGFDASDMWMEEIHLTGEEAREELNLDRYEKEAKKRGLLENNDE